MEQFVELVNENVMKKVLFTLFFVGITILNFAQISIEGNPTSFTNALFQDIPIYQLPIVNEEILKAEDERERKEDKATPLRFGQDFQVQLNLNNSGVWETLPNGDRVWRLQIESRNAKSLNFIFSDFYMPQGGKFFIYNVDKTYLIGAFTALNNKTHGKFSTAPVKGNSVILEYFEPKSVEFQGRLEVSSIVHAYRDMFETADDYIQTLSRDFGGSGSCNVDVNCSTGANWQDEKRSVAMILTSGNTRWCTGAMVNNTAQDTTPYFLTGRHCLDGNEDTWLFIFNYESPMCNGGDGDLTQSISGSTTRAAYNQSDLLLLELSTKPPSNYLVYYAGWDRSGIASSNSAAIHHPNGDVKKISIDNDFLVNGYSYNSDHWRVENWDIGTTESGSSGGPLFDQNKRIIGQLHGGAAACNNQSADEYGKFSVSWLGAGTNGTQLKHWLDPTNNNPITLDGRYFVSSAFTNNLRVDSISGISGCGEMYSPIVTVTNMGNDDITTLDITYQYAGFTPQTMQWTGNLSWLGSTNITLPSMAFSFGSQSLTVDVSIPNIMDEDVTNNSSSKTFTVDNSNIDVTLQLQTDKWPQEISYKVINSNGATVFQIFSAEITGSQYENTLITNELCLPQDCYKVIIEDSYGDGLVGGNNSSSGFLKVLERATYVGGTFGDFGSSDTIPFCIPSWVSTEDSKKKAVEITVFPNPTSGNITFESDVLPMEVIVINVLGKRVGAFQNIKEPTLDLNYLDNGMYFIQFRFEDEIVVRTVQIFK